MPNFYKDAIYLLKFYQYLSDLIRTPRPGLHSLSSPILIAISLSEP